MKKILSICLLLFAMTTYAVTLPAVLSSNMVLQRNASVKLWGWGNPGEKVFVSTTWHSKTDSTVVNGDGKWHLPINTPGAGGPHTITIKGYNSIVLQNILIGEVWLCSGQSNMEYNYNWGLPQMKADLPTAHKYPIRFFNVPKTTAETPQDDCKATWTVSDSNTLQSFSAVAFYFARRLTEELNVPVGLINASWGGTPAEVWAPAEKISNDTLLAGAAKKLWPSNGWPIKPGYAYNAMIAPLTNYVIAGANWYQGESNTGTAASYQPLLSTLIQSWRGKWNSDFPFYFVQLAPYRYGNKNIAALLREAQAKTLAIPKTGMVITTDLAEDTLDIHPRNKRDVGIRLATLALADHYGKSVLAAKSPMYHHMEILENKIVLSFDATGQLIIKGKAVTGLVIAGEDKIFYPARAVVKGGTVVAWSKAVPKPIAVRYAFSNTAVGNLYSKEGMPVGPFRTDDWPVDTSTETQKK